MPVNRGPGVRQIGAIGTTPKEHRLALAGQYAENAPGVPRSGVLVQGITNLVTPTAATAPMTYLVGEAATVISRGVGDGVYTPTTVGATVANRTVATANAPATGSRWDLVWIKQNDQEKVDANNDAIIGVTSGTAQASPTRPTGSVPAGALILSEHQIFSGTASTTAAPNTSTQLWRHTAARGAPTPVRTATERAEITTPAIGQQVIALDVAGAPAMVWTGTRWAWAAPYRHGKNRQLDITVADSIYKTLCTVNATTLGGVCEVRFDGVLANANSGAVRSADVQILLDGVTSIVGITYALPLTLPGIDSPVAVAFSLDTAALPAGSHVFELRTRGSLANAVRNIEMTLTVTEQL